MAEEVKKQEESNVLKGGVTIKKKSLGRKIWDTFIGEDAHVIGENIVNSIVVPTIKDIIIGTISAALYGGFDTRSSYLNNGGIKRDYNRISKSGPSTRRVGYDDDNRSYDDYASIGLDFRQDAQIILNEWREYLSDYGKGAIADYYDIVRECFARSGKKIQIDTVWTDAYRGWYKEDMQEMRVVPRMGKYYIDMPRPVELKR